MSAGEGKDAPSGKPWKIESRNLFRAKRSCSMVSDIVKKLVMLPQSQGKGIDQELGLTKSKVTVSLTFC